MKFKEENRCKDLGLKKILSKFGIRKMLMANILSKLRHPSAGGIRKNILKSKITVQNLVLLHFRPLSSKICPKFSKTAPKILPPIPELGDVCLMWPIFGNFRGNASPFPPLIPPNVQTYPFPYLVSCYWVIIHWPLLNGVTPIYLTVLSALLSQVMKRWALTKGRFVRILYLLKIKTVAYGWRRFRKLLLKNSDLDFTWISALCKQL